MVPDLGLLVERLSVFIQGCYNKKELGTKKTVLFIGPPNSGKSSVFNRLLGFERALVSDVAGTTRDLIESEVFYNELSFSVIDSAGIRSTADKIESRGIDFTVDGINDADVIVAVFENTKVDLLLELEDRLRDKKVITVLNKIDLCGFEDAAFDSRVSAKTGQGFDEFKNLIKDAFGDVYKKNSVYLVRDRHIKLFSLCLEGLNKAHEILQNNKEMEIAAEELKVSRSYLDDLVGRKTPDDVLGDIFSNFCIGK